MTAPHTASSSPAGQGGKPFTSPVRQTLVLVADGMMNRSGKRRP
ncbi:hypothetical protein OHT57_44920 [Streptomyces sp. NBC_00285]|nr:hypothetical protein [Streptomyces sp. NBC_00285]